MGIDLLMQLYKQSWAKFWNFLFETTETIVTKLWKNSNNTVANLLLKSLGPKFMKTVHQVIKE